MDIETLLKEKSWTPNGLLDVPPVILLSEALSICKQAIKDAKIEENKTWRHIAEFSHDITEEQFDKIIKQLESE